jgi:hypothetical protein
MKTTERRQKGRGKVETSEQSHACEHVCESGKGQNVGSGRLANVDILIFLFILLFSYPLFLSFMPFTSV